MIRFGKGLFIGMAWVAGAGSIITLLGTARGAVAIGFFKDIVGRKISFFKLSYYMFLISWVMIFLLWGFTMIFFMPEKKRIIGIKERSAFMLKEMESMSRAEVTSAAIIFALSMSSFIPALAGVDKIAIVYDSDQFATREFFGYGLFVFLIWPMMGMPVLLG